MTGWTMDVCAAGYANLSPSYRLRILQRFNPQIDAAPSKFDVSIAPARRRDPLADALEIISMLGNDSADTLVQLALSDHGISGSALPDDAGQHDRAALLWLTDENHARRILRWWYANVAYTRPQAMESYRLPNAAPRRYNRDIDQQPLTALIADTLAEIAKNAKVKDCRVSMRPAIRPGLESGSLIQIDVECVAPGKRFRFEDDLGEVVSATLRLISDLVILLEPDRCALHIYTRFGGHRLKQALAQATIGFFYEQGGEPQVIPLIPVHPEKLALRPVFPGGHKAPLVDIRTSRLFFTTPTHPAVSVTLQAENDRADLYSLQGPFPGLAHALINAGGLTFRFRKRDGSIADKVAYLRSPNHRSFKHFTTDEQEMAEEALTRAGLLDGAPHRGRAGPLDLLDTMTEPVLASAAIASMGSEWFHAFSQIGALASGPEAEHVVCPSCLRLHKYEFQDEVIKIVCREGELALPREASHTFVFKPDVLAHWLCRELKTDARLPSQVQPGIWQLGVRPGAGRSASVGFRLAFNLTQHDRFASLSHRLEISPGEPPGYVITLGSALLATKLPGKWEIVGLAGLITLDADGMHILDAALDQMRTGRLKKGNSQKQLTPELYSQYRSVRRPGMSPKDAESAVRDVWPPAEKWARGSIAKKLRNQFPEHFELG